MFNEDQVDEISELAISALGSLIEQFMDDWKDREITYIYADGTTSTTHIEPTFSAFAAWLSPPEQDTESLDDGSIIAE